MELDHTSCFVETTERCSAVRSRAVNEQKGGADINALFEMRNRDEDGISICFLAWTNGFD